MGPAMKRRKKLQRCSPGPTAIISTNHRALRMLNALIERARMGSTLHSHSVFVYGSLLSDDVVSVILKRIPQSSPAILDGFHRFSIKGRVYPAIIPVQDQKVTGRVLFGITDPELEILDEFEDVEYERSSVHVSLIDTLEKVQTNTYVWKDKADPHLYGDWNFEEWKEVHKRDFLKMTTGFVEELQTADSKPRVATYESFYQQSENPTLP